MTNEKNIILAVDDETNNLEILNRYLSSHYQIITCSSGEQALDVVFSSQQVDIILLDIMMPQMNGFDVALELKKNELTRDIPIIFITGQMDPQHISRGFELGGQDYITKPYHLLELKARIDTHLKLKKQQEELSSMNLHLENMVAERTKALQNTLNQKEALILELTHRVKNMLQMSISLLQLRIRKMLHPESQNAMQDFLCSIQVISLAHNLTQNEKDLINIPVQKFFNQLMPVLKPRFADLSPFIVFKTLTDPIHLHINTIIPLGLLMTEILSAIFKHTEPLKNAKEILFQFHKKEGKNFIMEIDFHSLKPLQPQLDMIDKQLNLAHLLGRQLNGELQFIQKKAKFVFNFKEPELKTYNPYVEQ